MAFILFSLKNLMVRFLLRYRMWRIFLYICYSHCAIEIDYHPTNLRKPGVLKVKIITWSKNMITVLSNLNQLVAQQFTNYYSDPQSTL